MLIDIPTWQYNDEETCCSYKTISHGKTSAAVMQQNVIALSMYAQLTVLQQGN